MSMIRINHDPSRPQLAVFAALWLVFLSGWAAISWWRAGPLALTGGLAAAAVLIPAAGAVSPKLLRIVYLGMSYLALPLGWVVSHLLLLVIYYVVMTPIGLAMRLFGYDPLRRRFNPQATSYWIERPEQSDAKRYFRQY